MSKTLEQRKNQLDYSTNDEILENKNSTSIATPNQVNKEQLLYKVYISTSFLEFSTTKYPLELRIHGDKSTMIAKFNKLLNHGDVKQESFWFKDIGTIIGIQVSLNNI